MDNEKDIMEFAKRLCALSDEYKTKLSAQKIIQTFLEFGLGGAIGAAPTLEKGIDFASKYWLESITTFSKWRMLKDSQKPKKED
jgi:hypothetical protein